MTKRPTEDGDNGKSAPPKRRPYRKPELVAYGPLAKLTRGTRSGTGEATPQGAMRKCL